MNRKTFIQKLGGISGFIFGIPSLMSGNVLHSPVNSTPDQSLKPGQEGWDGHKPKILSAPWGQKVFYDQYTYTDMQNSLRLQEGLPYEELKLGELSFRQGPTKLLNRLWLIDVDGQQNTYLISSMDGLILIDPGMTSTTYKVVEQIMMLGFEQEDVKYILLTHCHVDHAQSAAYWQEGGAEVMIHREGVNPIKKGNEITAWWLNSQKKDRSFPGVKKVTQFQDGDTLTLGEHKFFVCHTPGHTPDSSCFYFELEGKHILVSGDTIFHYGKHGWMGHPYSDYEIYLKSLWKLKRFAVEGEVHNEQDRIMIRNPIPYDMLLPGHTAISMDQVERDIDKGIEIMSYTLQQRRKGIDYQWTEPYTFFAEREVNGEGPIRIEYR